MDQTAVKQIQDTAAAIALAQGPLASVSEATPLVALPDNFALHDLERYLPQRSRFRASFRTAHIASFADYHQEHGPAAIFIDPEAMAAISIYNVGTTDEPGHGDHTAALQLEKTASFKAFLRFIGAGPHDQRTIAEWVEDWRDYVTGYDSEGTEIPPIRMAAGLRKVDIESARKVSSSESDFAANRSVIEDIEAKSADGSLPSFVSFACAPYHGLTEQIFQFRISVVTSGEKLRFSTRRVQEEADTEETATQFVEVLKEAVGTDAPIYQGTYQL